MKFRGTRDDTESRAIAADYSETVDRLIVSGAWNEIPPPEDQLPDDWMRQKILDFWSKAPSAALSKL